MSMVMFAGGVPLAKMADALDEIKNVLEVEFNPLITNLVDVEDHSILIAVDFLISDSPF